MNRYAINSILFAFTIFCNPYYQSYAQSFDSDDLKLVLLKPTGEIVDDLPVMEHIPDTSEIYLKVHQTIQTSFIGDFLNLYWNFQSYLKIHSRIDTMEPAYLALTEKDGGFARFGFCLRTSEGLLKKANTPYIDITETRATSDPNKLMSFTQLFPHEVGHVFIHELCREDTTGYNTKSVNMHFFPVVTDYSTAMNEGFAEHIENVARMYEENPAIKAGIMQDSLKIHHMSEKFIGGFENDLEYPFRLGYYKTTMIYWFQQYEDLRRYNQAISGEIRYKNRGLPIRNRKDRLTFRNSGVRLNKKEIRNTVQMHATEGAVSAFFTALTASELGNHYLDSNFYTPFFQGLNPGKIQPIEHIKPWQNQFLKYFKVFHEFVFENNSQRSQFADFIVGYSILFPNEKETLLTLYENTLGMEFDPDLPPAIWVLVKDYEHRLLVFDPFDAITIPLYTFDLNAAEVEDLLTLDKIRPAEAEKIIQYRKKNGFFKNIDELRSISGVSELSKNAILSSVMEERYFESLLENFEPKLSFQSLLLKPIKYFIIKSLLYFGIIILGIIFIIKKRTSLSWKRLIWLILRYGALWMLLVFAGLILTLLVSHPVLAFLGFFMFIAGLTWLYYRNRIIPRNHSMILLFLMGMLILPSLF